VSSHCSTSRASRPSRRQQQKDAADAEAKARARNESATSVGASPSDAMARRQQERVVQGVSRRSQAEQDAAQVPTNIIGEDPVQRRFEWKMNERVERLRVMLT